MAVAADTLPEVVTRPLRADFFGIPSRHGPTMHGIAGHQLPNGISWQLTNGPFEYRNVDGVFIAFPFWSRVGTRRALEILQASLVRNKTAWLSRRGNDWYLDLNGLRELAGWKGVEWMTGTIAVSPEVETRRRRVFDEEKEETTVTFALSREEIRLAGDKRIFLSHKGVDKPFVRRIESILRLLGFDPWLDEDAMPAGVELERALLAGMKDSCAAVFFVTSNYVDENFLATEINYALSQKRERAERFSIITLAVPSSKRIAPTIPDILKTYVWKNTNDELDMLREIVAALPICVGDVRWRD